MENLEKILEMIGSTTVFVGFISFIFRNKIGNYFKKDLAEFQAQRKAVYDLTLKKIEREHNIQDNMTEYKLSFIHSLNDLQSRIYHLVKSDMVNKYHFDKEEETPEKHYLINNTVFLIAQYFAWLEKIRTEVKFIKLKDESSTNELARLLDQTFTIWQKELSSKSKFSIWAGNQRAIGEIMLENTDEGRKCVGYGKFLMELSDKKNPIISSLDHQVLELLGDIDGSINRLNAIHSALIDTILLIDSEERVDRRFLQKLV